MALFLQKLLFVLRGKRKQLILMLFLFLLLSCLEVISIGMVGPFIAVATNPNLFRESQWVNAISQFLNINHPNHFLIFAGIALVAVFYGKALLAFTMQKSIFEFGFYLRRDLSVRLMQAYLSAPYTFHLASNSAVLINNTMTETQNFCTNLVMALLTSISNACIAAALVLLLMRTDIFATALISTLLLIAFLLFNQLKSRLYLWGKNASDANADMIRVINHGLGGIKETRVIGCESYFLGQLKEKATDYAANVSSILGYNNLPRFMIEALLMTFLVGFTSLFVLLNQESQKDLVSILGIFALSSIRLMPASANIFSSLGTIRSSMPHLDRIYLDLLQLEGDKRRAKSSKNIERSSIHLSSQIVLKNLSYRYPGAPRNSLNNITLTLQKGQSIGLIGKSGAGKTTLIDVLLGLLEPQAGDIQVDGEGIYATDRLRAWQNSLGYVPQSIFLIDDTIERNIAFGVPDELIDQQKLTQAIQVAQLSELMEQLPRGIKTEVGERGIMLSGGQRQRLGIARAIYHEREVLVFDEATAALDHETENHLTESIRNLSHNQDKTMIIVAHRLSTLQHCNSIYVMDEGRIIKQGSYEDVITKEKAVRS
jgi:ATP-binding cassette, subfamily B, bacterial PglK